MQHLRLEIELLANESMIKAKAKTWCDREVLATFPEGLISVMVKLAPTRLVCHWFALTNILQNHPADTFHLLNVGAFGWDDRKAGWKHLKAFSLMFKADLAKIILLCEAFCTIQ